MSNFTAINHPGVEDPALKKEPVESDFEIHEDPDVEQGDREDAPPASTNGKKGAKVSVTPRKRGRKPAVKKDVAIKGEDSDEDNKENAMLSNDESPTKKTRVAAGRKTRPIPTSYETASDEDKMILRLKDQENRSWAEIAHAWTEMTGEQTKVKSLSTRYIRIKANLAVLSKEHEDVLVQVKKDIEEKLETEKWQRIAEAMERIVGEKFPALTLQKTIKKLEKATK